MIQVLQLDPSRRIADLNVVAGCLTCGQDVEVRTTPHGSWSHCRNCRRVAPTRVAVFPGGIQVVEAVAVA